MKLFFLRHGIAAHLMGADEQSLKLKKAGLIRVEVDECLQPGYGRLTALLTPKMLLMAADSTAEARKEPEDADDHGA